MYVWHIWLHSQLGHTGYLCPSTLTLYWQLELDKNHLPYHPSGSASRNTKAQGQEDCISTCQCSLMPTREAPSYKQQTRQPRLAWPSFRPVTSPRLFRLHEYTRPTASCHHQARASPRLASPRLVWALLIWAIVSKSLARSTTSNPLQSLVPRKKKKMDRKKDKGMSFCRTLANPTPNVMLPVIVPKKEHSHLHVPFLHP
ncbi:hypothetical protein V8C37DRAFT_7540 [Trichoderma ceciliae]